MAIAAVSAADPLSLAPVERTAPQLPAADEVRTAASFVLNPRIEFDPKLGIAVLVYQEGASHAATYYPEAARQDLSGSDWDLSA